MKIVVNPLSLERLPCMQRSGLDRYRDRPSSESSTVKRSTTVQNVMEFRILFSVTH